MSIHIYHDTAIFDTEATTEIRLKEEDGVLYVKADCDYYGKVDFAMEVETAEAFAEAIKRQCKFVRERVAKEGV